MAALFRWIIRLLLGLLCCLVLAFAVVTIFKIPINLTGYKDVVESLAGEALDRKVMIKDSIVITTSLAPVFTLQGLQIDNPEGFPSGSFLSMDNARIQVELLPLLRKKVHITDIGVNNLKMNLVEDASGAVNWAVSPKKEDKNKTSPPPAKEPPEKQQLLLASDSIVVRNLIVDNLVVQYFTPDSAQPDTFSISTCKGTMVPGEPLHLTLAGELLAHPFTTTIEIASLDEFLTENRSWMVITHEIAGAKVSFDGQVNLAESHRHLKLKSSFAGDQLQGLNSLLNINLPPFSPYQLNALASVEKNHINLSDFYIQIGTSTLHGNATLEKKGDITAARLELTSPVIQLDDFTFEDWAPTDKPHESTDTESKPEPTTAEADTPETQDNRGRALLSPEVLQQYDIEILIRADKVLSGNDELGKGTLTAAVKDGRITIKPLTLTLPGGSINLAASVKPGTDLSEASLRATIEHFDIGVLARRSKPGTKMGGIVNLDVDLQSTANDVDQILENGNGYFDFSGQLTDFSAGIIDLWAVNLVAAIVSNTDENQSNINCTLGRWSVKDGLLTPDIFFIDTSKIRICADGEVDFKKKMVDLRVSPMAKKPQFFSLATPLQVQGKFSDIGLGVATGGIVGTTIKFITSPVHVPLQKLFKQELPADGNDVCSIKIGPDNRSGDKVRGCH